MLKWMLVCVGGLLMSQVASSAPLSCRPQVHTDADRSLRQSPRRDEVAERLALRQGRTLVADREAYRRIARDLQSIRNANTEKITLRAWPRVGVHSMMLRVTPESYLKIQEGTFRELDCLNRRLGATMHTAQDQFVSLSFNALYHRDRIREIYESHPSVVEASPSTKLGDGDDIELCATELGGIHRYVVSHGSGDCSTGCIERIYYGYDVDPQGTVDWVGTWSESVLHPRFDRPHWLQCATQKRPISAEAN